jgi:hypothetical protein
MGGDYRVADFNVAHSLISQKNKNAKKTAKKTKGCAYVYADKHMCRLCYVLDFRGSVGYPTGSAILPPQVKPDPAVQEKQWSPTGIRVPGAGR